MFSTTGRVGKLIATASTLALASVGLIGVTAANAEDIVNKEGSLTIHKSAVESFDDRGDKGDGNIIDPAPGPGLAGVEFEIHEVLFQGDPIDLTVSEGWDKVNSLGATPSDPFPAVGSDFTLGDMTPVVTGADGSVTANGLHTGLYYVEEVGSGDHLISQKVEPFFVTIPYPNKADNTWNYNVHVYPKNVKTGFDATKTVDAPVGLIGQNVPWQISVKVPSLANPYESLTIADDMTGALEFVSWGAVTLNGTTLEANADYEIVDGVIVFTENGLQLVDTATADAEATVVVVVNSKVIAVPEDGVVPNVASVKLNGNEEKSDASTNVGQLIINKVDKNDLAKVLAGAEFAIYASAPDADGNPVGEPLATAPTDVNGVINWKLHLGDKLSQTFWVVETKAPDGYVLPADPWTEILVEKGTVTANTVEIKNFSPTGPDLPLTGAQGTLLFTVAGIGLMVAAGGALMVRRARRNHS